MQKRQKKQRHIIKIQQVNDMSLDADILPDNSSSIIPIDHQVTEQGSMQNLLVQPKTKTIKIEPRNSLVFELEQQKQQEIQYSQQKTGQFKQYPNKQNQYRKKQQQKYQQNQQKRENKETVSTFTISSNPNIKNIHVKQQLFQEKVNTQRYEYNREESLQSQGGENQQQQQDEQYEIIQQIPRKKLKTVEKTFVAQTFDDLIFGKIPPNCTISCAVNFNHQFLSLKRTYDLYLIAQKKYLISAEKKVLKLTSSFEFFNKKAKTKQILGELKSNFTGLQYVVNKIHKNEKNRISQQCWIGYDSNMLGLSNQRNITVLKNQNAKLQKIPFFSQIKNYYENGITQKFQKFINKKASQNKNGNYQLDFKGKVNNPSSFNFILTDLKDQQCILFGKRNKTTYILQIGYPLSIFQGFAIAVSNLDHKLCVR